MTPTASSGWKTFAAAALVALAAATVSPAAIQAGDVSFADPLPVSPDEAPLLFEQCSRLAPTPEGALWVPSGEEIATLEARLLEHLRTLSPDTSQTPSRTTRYQGQHVGFIRAGVRYIYASYFPANLAEDHRMRPGQAVIVCDGGQDFFGIVFNPATGTFSELEVNGQA